MAPRLERVVRVKNPNYVRNGLKSYVYLMNKYSFGPTQPGPYSRESKVTHQGKFGVEKLIGGKTKIQRNLVKKATDGSQDRVPSEDQQNDSEYLTPVEIGSTKQKFMLDFDTGSSDLWLFSTELPSATLNEIKAAKHAVFDPTKSTTYKESSGSTWKIQYGDGSSASGIVGTDDVTIGGLTIEGQAIELANQVADQFAQGAEDGLLGLAFGTINTVTPTPVKTPVENMIAQQDIPQGQELFTAYLGSWRDKNAADSGESFYTFGFIDPDVLSDAGVTEPSYTPVDNSQGFWMVDSASATVGGKEVTRSGNTAIIDTGTTLALVDDDTVKAIYDAIPGSSYDSQQQGYVFPTSTKPADLPVVTFAVGDKQFAVPKEALAFADAGNNTVYGGIQSRGDMTFDILGDTFLKGIYAVFDQGQTRFGAVQRKDQTGDTLAPPESG